MEDPVNLTNLRSMTDGDADLEKSLFEEFVISFEKELAALKSHCATDAVKAWHAASHALKGISYNLGAQKLGDLCKLAQEKEHASENTKSEVAKSIETEYAVVKQF